MSGWAGCHDRPPTGARYALEGGAQTEHIKTMSKRDSQGTLLRKLEAANKKNQELTELSELDQERIENLTESLRVMTENHDQVTARETALQLVVLDLKIRQAHVGLGATIGHLLAPEMPWKAMLEKQMYDLWRDSEDEYQELVSEFFDGSNNDHKFCFESIRSVTKHMNSQDHPVKEEGSASIIIQDIIARLREEHLATNAACHNLAKAFRRMEALRDGLLLDTYKKWSPADETAGT